MVRRRRGAVRGWAVIRWREANRGSSERAAVAGRVPLGLAHVVVCLIVMGSMGCDGDSGGRTEEAALSYGSLAVDVEFGVDTVLVHGTTDVPCQSRVVVELHSLEHMRVVAAETVTVRDGSFRAGLAAVRGSPAGEGGPHRIRATFSPGMQRSMVLRRIGKRGERLIGEAVRDHGIARVLVAERVVDLPTGAAGDPTLPPLSVTDPASPKGIVLEMLYAWKARRWHMVETLTGPAWADAQDGRVAERLGQYRPLSAHRFEVDEAAPETTRVVVHSLLRRDGAELSARLEFLFRWRHGRWSLDPTHGLTVRL